MNETPGNSNVSLLPFSSFLPFASCKFPDLRIVAGIEEASVGSLFRRGVLAIFGQINSVSSLK